MKVLLTTSKYQYGDRTIWNRVIEEGMIWTFTSATYPPPPSAIVFFTVGKEKQGDLFNEGDQFKSALQRGEDFFLPRPFLGP